MGCWNGTCGLSGLPIIAGTKVLLFPLVQGISTDWSSGFCYTTDVWQPACLPIRGVYDDYGSIEEVESIPLMTKSHLEEHFKIKIVPEEDFLRDLERGNIPVTNLFRNQVYKMGQVLIREDIWNALLKCSPEHLEASKKDVILWVEKLKEIRHDKEAKERFWFSQILGINVKYDSSLFAYYLDGATQLYVLKGMKYPLGNNFIEQKCSEEHLIQFSNSIAEVLHVDSLMSSLRKAWMPQSGAGSQQMDFEFHKQFACIVSDVCDKEIKTWDDEYGEHEVGEEEDEED